MCCRIMSYRHTGHILLYDSRQRWICQGQGKGMPSGPGAGAPTPVLLTAHRKHLLTNEAKSSYVACQSLVCSEFSVRDSSGHVHIHEV